MKFRKHGSLPDKIELQMTPMIDIVFNLLVFFIMTFRIAGQEGDFHVKMPLSITSSNPDSSVVPPMQIRLRAGPDGDLAGIALNDIAIGTMEGLRIKILDILGDQRGPGSVQAAAEVELDCDYGLRYEHTMEAITAVSGYMDESGNVVKLVEKIRFAPPRTDAG
jgi:biopolymer transport protein ExbD